MVFPTHFWLLFAAAMLISGIGAVSGWQWLIVAIIFVMFSGARRL